MLKQYIDRLGFTIETFHISTNALAIGIFENDGNVAVECGNLDLSTISSDSSELVTRARKVLSVFSGYGEQRFTVFLQGEKNDVFIAPVSSGLFLLALFPKSVNIFDIRHDVERFVSDISGILAEIKPYIQTR